MKYPPNVQSVVNDMGPHEARPALRMVVRLALLGLLLLVCIAQSEYLLTPVALEPLGRTVYRIAYMIILPVRAIVFPFLGQVDHHWPLRHTLVACLGAPFFYWGLWRAWQRYRERRMDTQPESQARNGVSRRMFLAGSAVGAAGVTVGGYGVLVEPECLKVRRYDMPIQDLPEPLNGLRIMHIADTHYGPFVSLAYLERAVAQANALQPDLVALTGDYVHRSRSAVVPGIGVLGGLRSRLGTLAVLGNHEYWEGAEACREALRGIGATLLDNAHVYLTPEGFGDTVLPGKTLCMAGVGDLWENEVSFYRALENVPLDLPSVVLSHNPDAAEIAEPGYRVDLMLAGHTHGGQVRFPIIGAPISTTAYGSKYIGGLCYGPHFPVIVSRGVGLAGIPIRLGVPPELVLITLKRA